MAKVAGTASLSADLDTALSAPWSLLEHDSRGGEIARAQALDNIEDAGRTEDRVRLDYSGRYPVELLQNAHDACADAKRRGAVRIAITETALIVANDGMPFTPKRVRSLVRLGSSDKADQRQMIGYKGIGFTSVFEVSDRPQIISQGVAFQFDRPRAKREIGGVLGARPALVPARGFPFKLEQEDWAADQQVIQSLFDAGAVTAIRLPLRKDRSHSEVVAHVGAALSPEVLLFMPWVNELELVSPDGDWKWTKMSGKKVGAGTLVHLRSDQGDRRSWLVATTSFRVRRADVTALDDPLWADVRDLNAAVALPWKQGIDPSVGPQHLHVYFPTDDELGRALLIHGDFYIDSGRRHIETTGAGGFISEQVATAVARLTGTLAESVADQGHPLLLCLAPNTPVAGFGETVGGLLDDALRRAAIVRPADLSAPRRPGSMTRLAMGGSVKLERDLLPLLRPLRDLVAPGDDREIAGDFLDHLGVEELSWVEIAGRVDLSKTELQYGAALRLLARWIDHLEGSTRRSVLNGLRQQIIVQDVDGRWRKPEDVVIRREDAPELPSRLRLSELAIPAGGSIRRLVRLLDIPTLTPATALDILIDAVDEKEFGRVPAEAQQVHAFLIRAWQVARSDLEARSRRLGGMPVPARLMRGRRAAWQRADQVYFSSQWTGSPLMEGLYGRFSETEFLAAKPPSREAELRSTFAFYETLGVRAEPRTKKWSGNHDDPAWRQGLGKYSEWVRVPEVQAGLICSAGHVRTPQKIVFSCLDRLEDLLQGDLQTAGVLARYLASLTTSAGNDAVIACTATSHSSTGHHKRVVGYQRWLLESQAWLPVRNDPFGRDRRKPGETWTGSRIPSWLFVPQARLNLESARKLHVVSADRAPIGAIERALRDLEDQFPQLDDAPKDVVRSAMWLLKRLDRAHHRAEGQSTSPPLPCFRDGKQSWSDSPLIGDMTALDTLRDLEVLPPGPWQGLRRGYGLKKASEVVQQEVVIGKRVRAPLLLSREQQGRLAALLAGQGADEGRTPTRLARLRELSVESIRVSYVVSKVTTRLLVDREYYLDLQRDRANRVIGATLFVCPPTSAASRLSMARDLAAYLDISEMHSTIGLFLINADAVLESESVSSEDIADASRRVNSHRRGRNATEESDVEVEELLESPLLSESQVGFADDEQLELTEETPAGGRHVEHGPNSVSPGMDVKLPLLDHDGIKGQDVTGQLQPVTKPQRTQTSGSNAGGGGSASGSLVDWTQLERDRRLYGKRGEEAAYENERRRVHEMGWDPKLVRWVSRDVSETSPFDIQSIDDDGNTRFIEVKATVSNDPSEPFPISTAELTFAMRHRSRHFVYRVTDVKSATPRVSRYRDPLAEVESERGYIAMRQAVMALPGSPSLDN